MTTLIVHIASECQVLFLVSLRNENAGRWLQGHSLVTAELRYVKICVVTPLGMTGHNSQNQVHSQFNPSDYIALCTALHSQFNPSDYITLCTALW
jgi:hypothetical protein